MSEEESAYEIMPYKEIVELKSQIAELRTRMGDPNSKDLLASMAGLTKTMDAMLKLFSTAAEEMKLEEKTESELSAKIKPLFEKVERLEEQNKTIAEGLVAIADMVKEKKVIGSEGDKDEGFSPIKSHEEHPAELPSMEDPFPSMDQPPDFDMPSLEPPQQNNPIGGPPPMNSLPQRPMAQPFPQAMQPHGQDNMQFPPPRGMPPLPPLPPFGQGFGPLPPLPPLDDAPRKGLFGFLKK
ncbi:hypothetical protein HYU13_02705 [Candidatus Woesearchaeota archaeon]|nr:hypothetical protein [Candidatus Woesearchaeota archaeon]